MSDPLLTVANRVHADILRPAIAAWSHFLTAIREDGANTDACLLELIGAAEELERKGRQAAQLLRPELAKRMQEDGVTGFQSENWKASLREKVPEPFVTDEGALKSAHPELWQPQPDKFQTNEMKKLARKQNLPGVSLTNGGAPVLVVSARKDA
ncbi:hypothetical protein [Acetobacter okinawensis]|uniref:hypothetical protein n=1 Tax=Acetobacter okinawensis TaxID=1076594 RepID=UPI00117792AF|nr:hypothetical protein [Acetobacter okinawensis]